MRPFALADFETPGDAAPRPHEECYWLLPGRLLAGEHPGAAGPELMSRRLRAMQALGLGRFIDLTSPHDPVPAYEPLPLDDAVSQRESHPIEDFGLPSPAGLRLTLDAIAQALDRGERVYLHCKAGIGRTGTVAACLLVEQGMSPSQALALLQRKWQVVGKRHREPLTPETQAQRDFVAAWSGGRPAP